MDSRWNTTAAQSTITMRWGEGLKRPRYGADIVIKNLSLACPGVVLEVIGIDGVDVARALPTELDRIDIRQQWVDVVFQQKSGDILHLEFQTSQERNLYRFLAYDSVLAEKFRQKIRTVVLYTGNISKAPEELDIGSAQYRVENIYLKRFNGDQTLDIIKAHVQTDQWEQADRVRLAFAFQMQFVRRSPNEAFEQVLELIRTIRDHHEQNYVAAVILGLSGQQLREDQKQKLKEAVLMTDIAREIEEESLQKGIQQGMQQGMQKAFTRVAKNMLRMGASIESIVEATGLTPKEVQKIREELKD